MARMETAHELMTGREAAQWFRRSLTWLRRQRDLVRFDTGQPMFHIVACRAYVLGRLRGLEGPALRQVQIDALAAFCGLRAPSTPNAGVVSEPAAAETERPEGMASVLARSGARGSAQNGAAAYITRAWPDRALNSPLRPLSAATSVGTASRCGCASGPRRPAPKCGSTADASGGTLGRGRLSNST